MEIKRGDAKKWECSLHEQLFKALSLTVRNSRCLGYKFPANNTRNSYRPVLRLEVELLPTLKMQLDVTIYGHISLSKTAEELNVYR